MCFFIFFTLLLSLSDLFDSLNAMHALSMHEVRTSMGFTFVTSLLRFTSGVREDVATPKVISRVKPLLLRQVLKIRHVTAFLLEQLRLYVIVPPCHFQITFFLRIFPWFWR